MYSNLFSDFRVLSLTFKNWMSILGLWTVQLYPLFRLVTPVHIFFFFFCIYDQSTGSLCSLILTIYNQLINVPYLLIYGGLPPHPQLAVPNFFLLVPIHCSSQVTSWHSLAYVSVDRGKSVFKWCLYYLQALDASIPKDGR